MNIFNTIQNKFLSAQCRPLIEELADEQERTFLGFIEIYCNDHSLLFTGASNENLLKARLTASLMVAFSYYSLNTGDDKYDALKEIAYKVSNINNILNSKKALEISNSFVISRMTNMIGSYKEGSALERYCSILIELIGNEVTSEYRINYDPTNYLNLIQENVSANLRRARFIASKI